VEYDEDKKKIPEDHPKEVPGGGKLEQGKNKRHKAEDNGQVEVEVDNMFVTKVYLVEEVVEGADEGVGNTYVAEVEEGAEGGEVDDMFVTVVCLVKAVGEEALGKPEEAMNEARTSVAGNSHWEV